MPSREPRFEVAGGQRLPLGGLNGYAGVRGKQGRKKDKFQGATPRKQHRTGLFCTAQEAAIALAQLREDLELGMVAARVPKKAPPATMNGALRKMEVGVFLGDLLRQKRAAVPWVALLEQSNERAGH